MNKNIKILLITGFIFLMFVNNVHAGEVIKDEQPLVSIMLFETDLREALNEISLQTGVNIIPDQTVNGVVTADLQEVPLDKALQMILIGGGYTYRKIDDFYLVGLPVSNNLSFSELTEIELIELNHISVDDVFNTIPPFLQEYIKGNRNSNTVTITAPDNELKKIKRLIKKIDNAQKQIEVKVLVTEVDSRYAKNLGANLLDFDEAETGSNKLAYNLDDGLVTVEADFYGKLVSKLKIMEENHIAEIKANPKVLVADGESAELFIGEQQILLLTSEDNDISRTEEIEVGVGLEVKADIIGKDRLKLNLTPKVSRFVDSMRPDLVIKENSISTTLLLNSEQTLLLAGMTMQDESSSSSEVPLLGKIPVVRWLFKNEQEVRTDKEFLVFVTPVIHN